MIIKKPYAFLIKQFRLIHTLLFLAQVYIILKSIDLFSFFNLYATNHFYNDTIDLASTYINFIMFIVIILAILLGALIFYILSIKKKDRKTYIYLCIFYICLFIFFLIIFGMLQDLQYKPLSNETVRVIRDVCLLFIIPQIIFGFIILGRALGFNIKQFDFKRDLAELNIDSTDYEEVEITLGKNNYKIFREFRKILRHVKYFMLENKFFVTIIGSVITLALSLVIFINLRVYSVSYNKNDKVLANTLWYTVEDAYITNTDMNSNVINDGKYYVLVRVFIDNNTSSNVALSRNSFRLVVNNKLLNPTFSFPNMFLDVGKAFAPCEISSGAESELIAVFEIDEKDVKNEYIFKIRNVNNLSIFNIENEYKSIVINPYNLNSDNDTGECSICSESTSCESTCNISFSGSILFDTKLDVISYSIDNYFKEKYNYCTEKCYEGTYLIWPQTEGKGKLGILRLKSTIKVDEKLYMKKYLEYPKDLFKYYAKITYRYQGVTKTKEVGVIDTKYNQDNTVYLEVPLEVIDANKISIILTIRGIKYTILLK